jgi:hypothetical protein
MIGTSPAGEWRFRAPLLCHHGDTVRDTEYGFQMDQKVAENLDSQPREEREGPARPLVKPSHVASRQSRGNHIKIASSATMATARQRHRTLLVRLRNRE